MEQATGRRHVLAVSSGLTMRYHLNGLMKLLPQCLVLFEFNGRRQALFEADAGRDDPPAHCDTTTHTGRSAMYEQLTRGVRVRVEPQYIEDQSSPDEGYYFWAYTVHISNERDAPVQLRSRVWRITNALGQTEEIRGPGVVGQTPVIPPGESFTYTSGCPLKTPSGIMVGTYQMAGQKGELFEVAVPAFSLDSPHSIRSVN